MPGEFFESVDPHLPPERPVRPKRGAAPPRHRVVVRILWFVLATEARWEDVPQDLGCSSRTAHCRLRAWE
jgi:transposase